MSILEHKLIKEYFWPEKCASMVGCKKQGSCYGCTKEAAYEIIKSMQVPIKMGDRILEAIYDGDFVERKSLKDMRSVHYWALRLPERFQLERSQVDMCIDAVLSFIPSEVLNTVEPAQAIAELIEAVRAEENQRKSDPRQGPKCEDY